MEDVKQCKTYWLVIIQYSIGGTGDTLVRVHVIMCRRYRQEL